MFNKTAQQPDPVQPYTPQRDPIREHVEPPKPWPR